MKRIASIPKHFLLIVFFSLLFNFIVSDSKASENQVPSFPNCEDKIFTSNGDRAHYDQGIHGIPGIGNMEGSDDVYTLSNNNFLQCFCPSEGNSGIQSNWWNTNTSGLTNDEINQYKNSGWMLQSSGSGWGLTSDPYLVKNRSFSCDLPKVTLCHATASETNPYVVITIDVAGAFNGHLGDSHQWGEDIIPPFNWQGTTYSQNWDSAHRAIYDNGCNVPAPTLTPTPKPTATPGPKLTVTPTPVLPTSVIITPTRGNDLLSRCYDLEASPVEGTAPLTVRFVGHADDPATQGKIKQYRFDFADASGGQPQVVFQSDRVAYHRYELPGNYKAILRIQDNAGNWRDSGDCEVEIKVHAAPQVLGATSAQVLPATGLPETAALIVLILGPLGFYLYRRFRLV